VIVFWDIDGVLRDLMKGSGIELQMSWEDSKIVESVEEDFSVLVNSPALPYLDVLLNFLNREHSNLEHIILSANPESWRKYTNQWLDEHGLKGVKRIFTDTLEEKLDYLDTPDVVLIDDYPYFVDYGNILLIDHSYNKSARPLVRIKNPLELEICLLILDKIGER
jgi:hypothetical protein